MPCKSGGSRACNHRPIKILKSERYSSEKVLMGNANKGMAVKLNCALHGILKIEVDPATVSRT